jgi:hypothetical protein
MTRAEARAERQRRRVAIEQQALYLSRNSTDEQLAALAAAAPSPEWARMVLLAKRWKKEARG